MGISKLTGQLIGNCIQ